MRSARAGSENVQGEVQKKLDILSNEILLEANEWGGNLAGMASEEMEQFFPIPSNYPKGEYLLVFDPLDGSSNIDVNVSIGTIFSVLRCPDGAAADRTVVPAAGHAAGRRGLCGVRSANGAGADHRQRRELLHARPRTRLVGAHAKRHAHSGRNA